MPIIFNSALQQPSWSVTASSTSSSTITPALDDLLYQPTTGRTFETFYNRPRFVHDNVEYETNGWVDEGTGTVTVRCTPRSIWRTMPLTATTNTSTNWYIGTDTTATAGNVITLRVDAQGNLVARHPRYLKHAEPRRNHRGHMLRHDRRALFADVSAEEVVALQLLRKMVEPEVFRRYLKSGFVMVKGPSGLDYQIDRHDRIKVWDKGVAIATLCVHLKHEHACPPTDEVVAKMLLAELDEPDLWKRSNKSFLSVTARQRPQLALLGVAA